MVRPTSESPWKFLVVLGVVLALCVAFPRWWRPAAPKTASTREVHDASIASAVELSASGPELGGAVPSTLAEQPAAPLREPQRAMPASAEQALDEEPVVSATRVPSETTPEGSQEAGATDASLWNAHNEERLPPVEAGVSDSQPKKEEKADRSVSTDAPKIPFDHAAIEEDQPRTTGPLQETEESAGEQTATDGSRESAGIVVPNEPAVGAEVTVSEPERSEKIEDSIEAAMNPEVQPAQVSPAEPIAEAGVTMAEDSQDDTNSAAPAAQPGPSGPWVEPQSLLQRLDSLAWDCETGLWARETAKAVRKLGRMVNENPAGAPDAIQELEAFGQRADQLAKYLRDNGNPLATKVLRAQHALARRLDVWERVFKLGWPVAPADPRYQDSTRFSADITRLKGELGESDAGRQWRSYLELDRLHELAAQGSSASQAARESMAVQVLQRLSRARASAAQRHFLSGESFQALESEMRRWVLGPIDLTAMMAHVETYERTNQASDARLVADDCLRLSDAGLDAYRQLGKRLESHYRNANVRMVITSSLLNRAMPEREPERQWVNDRVLGHPVHGQSVTSTQVKVRLIPDRERLRLALDVSGNVSALTESSAGPATFTSDSQSTYNGSKEMELTMRGPRMKPAQVNVDNYISLRSVETDLDGIPLLGSIARNVARQKHDESRAQVSAELREKVAARAKQQIDEEVDARLAKVGRQLDDRLLTPLERMSLGPRLIEAETSEERLTMRLRLASGEQLGSSTPRPQAPGDSLLSFQIHESAINNVLEQLGLDGQTFTLAQLRRRVAERLNRPELLKMDSEHDDLTVTFADQDAVRVECRDGRVMITMSIAMLSSPPRKWRDFQAWVYFRPTINGRAAELARDGVIQLASERLSTGGQIAVRGVFSKMFPQERTLPITLPAFAQDRRLDHIGVTQFVIDDGWVGIAVGPSRARQSTSVAQQPAETVK